MTNKEILETLSKIEESMYQKFCGGEDRENVSFDDLQIMHSMIDECFSTWCRVTKISI